MRANAKGLSEAEFRERFGSEVQCRAMLFELRWGKGWACPGCGHGGFAELNGRAVYQCNRCKCQVGLTAGSVFHWMKHAQRYLDSLTERLGLRLRRPAPHPYRAIIAG